MIVTWIASKGTPLPKRRVSFRLLQSRKIFSKRRSTRVREAPSDAKPRQKTASFSASARIAPAGKSNCYGCGTRLQTEVPERLGYVEPDIYSQKSQYKQLDQLICRRCRALSHGLMVPAVEDAWAKRHLGSSSGGLLLSPEELRHQLASIGQQRALIVLLVDLLDASGSLLVHVRDLTGRNPVVIIGTKVDLLPKGTHTQGIRAWLSAMAASKQLHAIHTCLVSSKTQEGIADAAAYIRQSRLGRDVYVVGAANVGKSAFIRAIMRDMSRIDSRQFDPAAAHNSRRLPVTSAMPGTTLHLIPLQAFHTGGYLYDTPGLHVSHRIPHLLAPEEAKVLQPRGRLKPFVPPTPADLSLPVHPISLRQVSASYVWGGLARIDVVSAPVTCALAFYSSKVLTVFAQAFEEGRILNTAAQSTGFAANSLACSGGLRIAKQVQLLSKDSYQPLADIAISGMPGWATVLGAGRAAIQLRIWAPVGIEVFVRPPLPCPNPVFKAKC